MISSLNSSRPEPMDALRDQLAEHFIHRLGSEPSGLIIAPCRVEGYHLYSNAGFFTRDREALLLDLPDEFEGALAGGFVNIRVRESALRSAIQTLAQREPAKEERGFVSRLYALLALRQDEKDWGGEAMALAWLLVRGDCAGNYQEALRKNFELYFRQGPVDHDIVRAILARRGENQ